MCVSACVCVFVPLSAQTCNDPVVIRHTHTHCSLGKEWGRHEGNSSRGKEGLFMMPYFLSQHPLSSRGKSIPKVKGHPGGIPFVLSALLCTFGPECVYVCVSVMKTTPVTIFGLTDFFLTNSSWWACCVHFTFFDNEKFNDRQYFRKKRVSCSVEQQCPCPTSIKQQQRLVRLRHRLYTVWSAFLFFFHY